MAPTSLNKSEKTVILDVRKSLVGEGRKATFAVGGSLPIENERPVKICFGDTGEAVIMTLPAVADQRSPAPESQSEEALDSNTTPLSLELELLGATCSKVDEGETGRLDYTEFSTTFCPYTTGIIDVVQQVLMWNKLIELGNAGIVAKIAELTLYNGAGRRYKRDVKSLRGTTFVGTLVVALPIEHQGGQLVVRFDHGQSPVEHTFDWSQSSTSSPTIKWAAFYYDCEHEILPITSGSQILLTYELFAKITTGHLAGKKTCLEPTQLPLYKTLKQALDDPDFFTGGRILGVYLSHDYAHTSEKFCFLPKSLKGADMALYEVAKALQLRVYFRPFYDHPEDDPTGVYKGVTMPFRMTGANFLPLGFCDHTVDMEVNQLGHYLDPDDKEGVWSEGSVTWLNSPESGLKKAQYAYLAEDEETQKAHLAVKYTTAVMLIKIPPFDARGEPLPKGDGISSGINSRD